jgi:hypothetical protein
MKIPTVIVISRCAACSRASQWVGSRAPNNMISLTQKSGFIYRTPSYLGVTGKSYESRV